MAKKDKGHGTSSFRGRLLDALTRASIAAFNKVAPVEDCAPPNGECVVLLHGINSSALHMMALERQFKRAGYKVLNISYDSTGKTIEQCADEVHTKIYPETHDAKKLHFVAHSMGGLVTRHYMDKFNPQNKGRVVMVGTPNSGSALADLMRNVPGYGLLMGPAGRQLAVEERTEEKEQNKKIDYEVGIIAGTTKLNPVTGGLLLGDDDGMVGVNATKLDGMKEHLVLQDSHHLRMPYDARVIYAAVNFVQTGRFPPTELTPAPAENQTLDK